MTNPVVIQSGNTFERAAIEKFFEIGKIIDPITNQHLGSTRVSKNLALAYLIRKQYAVEEKEKEAQVNEI